MNPSPAPRVLIDAANLRNGGGIQVAASFVDALIDFAGDSAAERRYPWLKNLRIDVNAKVFDSLDESARASSAIRVLEPRPLEWRRWLPTRNQFDASFVVFGPEYTSRRATHRIVGYADVRSVYRSPRGESLSSRQRIRWAVRGRVSRCLMRSADTIVVETEAFRAQVIKHRIADGANIKVVSNGYHQVFDDPETWLPGRIRRDAVDCDYLLVYVARPYSHKNHDFLPRLRSEAKKRHGISLRFLVTLTDAEWELQTEPFRQACVNAGVVPIQGVPALYAASDAAIFPSLLEAFSVTPLEAMRMGRVVFGSDRDFVHATAGGGVVYLDPLNPVSAADQVVQMLADPVAMDEQRTRALELVKDIPSASQRAAAFVEIIDAALSDGNR